MAVEVPLAEAVGQGEGPTVAITAGMHAGEYAGILAASELIQRLKTMPLQGRVLIIPVQSTQAFFMRSMQLSPVDEREAHYTWPGRTDSSYTEHLIDLIFRTVRVADYVVDMHGGELVQDLCPWVGAPWLDDGKLWDQTYELATAFDVDVINKRQIDDTPLGLPRALLEEGIPNIWTEIGRNGLLEPGTIRRQREGALSLLRTLGVARGKPKIYSPRIVGPAHWMVVAEESGVWRPSVKAGETVERGQRLGALYDVFGDEVREFLSPGRAVVLFVCTSPAINADRRPGGYQWHQWLAFLAEDERS
jgi:predicted deacylase